MAEQLAEAAVADTLRKLAVVFADFEQRLEATPLIRKLTRGRFEVANYHAFLINLRQQVMGVALRPGQAELKKTLDEFVDRNKKNGELNKLYQKWLGTDFPSMPNS